MVQDMVTAAGAAEVDLVEGADTEAEEDFGVGEGEVEEVMAGGEPSRAVLGFVSAWRLEHHLKKRHVVETCTVTETLQSLYAIQ